MVILLKDNNKNWETTLRSWILSHIKSCDKYFANAHPVTRVISLTIFFLTLGLSISQPRKNNNFMMIALAWHVTSDIKGIGDFVWYILCNKWLNLTNVKKCCPRRNIVTVKLIGKTKMSRLECVLINRGKLYETYEKNIDQNITQFQMSQCYKHATKCPGMNQKVENKGVFIDTQVHGYKNLWRDANPATERGHKVPSFCLFMSCLRL